MGYWRSSGEITAKTWGLIKANRQLMRFATMAAVVGVAVFVVFMIPAAIVFAVLDGAPAAVGGGVLVFLGAWAATFASLRYIAGLVYVADKLLKGQQASFEDGMAEAARHTGPLAVWSLITVAVGWLLSAIRGGGDDNIVVTIIRVIAASLLAAAWSLITFFVLPVMILEGRGVVPSMKRSVAIIKGRWGDAVVGTFRIGARIALMFILPGILALVAGVGLAAGVGGAAGITAGVLCFIIGAGLIVVGCVRQTAARQVFGVALYQYAANGLVVGPFEEQELAGAVRAKSSKRR